MTTLRYAVVVANVTVRPSRERIAKGLLPSAQTTYHYSIPDELREQLVPGQLVWVPFGTQRVQALVLEIVDSAPVKDVRDVDGIAHLEPVLSREQIELAKWISDQYICPLVSSVRLMLPAGLEQRVQVVASVCAQPPWPEDLAPPSLALLDYLREHGEIPVRELRSRLRDPQVGARLLQLESRGLVERRGELAPPRVRPKVVRFVALCAGPQQLRAAVPTLGTLTRPLQVLELLAASPETLWRAEALCARTGVTPAVLSGMAIKGWIVLHKARQLAFATLDEGGLQAREADGSLDVGPVELDALRALLRASEPPTVAEWRKAGEVGLQTVRRLEAAGLVRVVSEPAQVHLAVSRAEAAEIVRRERKTDVYEAVVDLLAREGKPVWVSWLIAETGCSKDAVRVLAELGLVRLQDQEVERDPLEGRLFVEPPAPQLTPAQSQAVAAIGQAMDRGESRTFLLHGVTGSGKTEVYLRALARAIGAGKQAIVLVPEISLTPQTIQRFAARFPGRVAVMHSGLTDGERYDMWRKARSGGASIVIGARSAVFAPLRRLGLVVVDEEHEPSYKQGETAPRYHARDVAIRLGELTGATVILGSATPDVVTFRRAERGVYSLLTLPERILWDPNRASFEPGASREPSGIPSEARMASSLPAVEIVDLRQELKQGNRGIFSRTLHGALAETLAENRQAILFLNRRGAASLVMCRDCGHVASCPRCALPLTYHGESDSLVCHHCGMRLSTPDKCPSCESRRIRHFGLGTEKVFEAVHKAFPAARVMRWDRDTTGASGAHEDLLGRFSRHEADVLVGTQMIAKGLDLPLVTLVGVVSADTALFHPDYRAGERAFQLLTQVAGRAGRTVLGGKVIIQTYNPDHPSIVAASRHDYASYYRLELQHRKELGYPPFGRLARLVFSDASLRHCRDETETMAALLRERAQSLGLGGTRVLGPSPCFIPRLRGRFRWQILIRAADPPALLGPLGLGPEWAVDVDPMDAL